MQQWHIEFSGQVQGVGFRHTACQVANRLGLTGWVRNLPNGRVELVAEGSPGLDTQLVQQISEATYGFVQDVQIETRPAAGEFSGFSVRYDQGPSRG